MASCIRLRELEVDDLTAGPVVADLAPHATLFQKLEPDAVALAGFRVVDIDIGNMQEHFLFLDPATNAAIRVRAHVLFGDIQTFHKHAVTAYFQYAPAPPLVLAAIDNNLVVFLDASHRWPPKALPAPRK